MSHDPEMDALHKAHRAATWATRFAAAQFWIYVLCVGVPVLAVCACCGWFYIQ